MRNKGLFFVLDGPDGSGKTTQVALLSQRLKKEGKRVLVVDFPQYANSFFGKMVGEYLKGKFGNVFVISPYLSSLLYALDRWSARERMQKALQKGTVILANRFTSSNVIHQGAKFSTKREQYEYFQWLEKAEFTILGIPRPTKIFFLDVPTDVSWKLIENRNRVTHPQGSGRDQHEKSRKHLARAYAVAKSYAQQHPQWDIIPCTERKALLSPEEVHARVYRKISRYLS